jgi:hypothetical protein
MVSAARVDLSGLGAADFLGVAADFFFRAASARFASNGSSRDDASSCRARIDARLDALWISASSSALAGFSPAVSNRNSVLI